MVVVLRCITKKVPQKPVKTFNELFAPLDEAIKASDSLKDSDDVDKTPVSATVVFNHLTDAPVASAPIVATTTTSTPDVSFFVSAAAVSPASVGGGDVELDLDDENCFPV